MIKKKIREGVFETNSSSTHSISICTEDTNRLLDTCLQPNDDGVINLEGGEFGWGIEDHYDAITKANYIALWSNVYSGGRFDDVIKEVICNQTGAKEVIFLFSPDSNWDDENYSYIDHQSADNDYSYICEDKDLLRHFIFNRQSFLHLDNDNH